MATANLSASARGDTHSSCTAAYMDTLADAGAPTLLNTNPATTHTYADRNSLPHITARTSTCHPSWTNPNAAQTACHSSTACYFRPGAFPAREPRTATWCSSSVCTTGTASCATERSSTSPSTA